MAASGFDTDSLEALVAAVAPLLEERRIRKFLIDREESRSGSPRAMTIDVICSETVDPTLLTRRDLYLDKERLDAHFEESHCRLGAISENRTHEFIEQVNLRFTRRLAKRLAGLLSLPADLLQDAWTEHLFCELSQMLAARHLARRIARKAAGSPVLFPLDTTLWHYRLGFNPEHSMEPFYMMSMLQRYGVQTAFVCTDKAIIDQVRAEGRLILTFAPDNAAWGMPLPPMPEPEIKPDADGRKIFVPAGVRGLHAIIAWLGGDPLTIFSDAMMDPTMRVDWTAVDPACPPLALKLSLGAPAGWDGGGGTIFLSSPVPDNDLGKHFAMAVGPCTQAAVRRANDLVARHNVTEAHVCDDIFFAPSIYLHAVRARGGKVVFWPHSCNAGWPFVRKPGAADEIHCATEEAASEWREHSPESTVRVVSQLCLPRFRGFPEAQPDQPLNIVIIDNGFRVGRLAMLDTSQYDDTYRRLLPGLAEMAPDVRYVIKTRTSEALQRLVKIARQSPAFDYTTAPPVSIDLPNMIFLFSMQFSSAMYEGMARGIPALAVQQDREMRQYIKPAPCVPIGSIPFILDEIARCRDPEYRLDLSRKQHEWFKEQTVYPDQSPLDLTVP